MKKDSEDLIITNSLFMNKTHKKLSFLGGNSPVLSCEKFL